MLRGFVITVLTILAKQECKKLCPACWSYFSKYFNVPKNA
jgi:hypothetical protein